jgi:DNA-binding NarL/FixJ family response regulator
MMHTDKALSSQNIDVLRLMARGSANKEIAAKPSITEETMKGHTKSIFNNLSSTFSYAATIGATRHWTP